MRSHGPCWPDDWGGCPKPLWVCSLFHCKAKEKDPMIGTRMSLVAFFCLVVSASSAADGPPAPNLDPEKLRGIVRVEAAKRGARAVEFGVWRAETKILTMA